MPLTHSGPELRGVCPIDLQPLEPVASCTEEDVNTITRLAHEAQTEWVRLGLEDRIKALKAATKEMLQKRHEAMEIVRLEIGKLDVDALFTEGLGPIDTLNAWIRIIRGAQNSSKVRLNPIAFPGKSAHIEWYPLGVIGIISPWNFPIAGLYRSVFPSLLLGNSIVVKPSEHAVRSSSWFLDILAKHLPENIVNVVAGGPNIGKALIESNISSVIFTGSYEVGRQISAQAAQLGIPCSTETGGKDAALVLADADLERTTAGLTQWALQNAGQSCGAIEVAYLDNRIADELVSRLLRAWARLRVGPGPVAQVDISPLANEAQLQKVHTHVEDARSKGAEILTGGTTEWTWILVPTNTYRSLSG